MANGTFNPLSMISGVGNKIADVFKGGSRSNTKPSGQQNGVGANYDIMQGYPFNGTEDEKIKYLVNRYDQESTIERIQFARKWFRNLLIYMGYHELEWSEINVAWEAVMRSNQDFAYPNNHYRSLVRYGAALYVQTSPEFIAMPTTEDPEAQACAESARVALDIMKENVKYDCMRVLEAINLRLFGNSFRYSYFSLDPRYGMASAPVFQDVQIDIPGFDGASVCPQCGFHAPFNAHMVCPQCGAAMNAIPPTDPASITYPMQAGVTHFPKGQEMSEVVWPLEVYIRSSSKDLFHAPYLHRKRLVDRVALAAIYPNADMGKVGIHGEAAGVAAEDLSLVYQESTPDLPSDPTQYAAWYEQVTGPSKITFIQSWIRPSMYATDKELAKKYPDGIYSAMAGDELLDKRNESLDDHWVHLQYIPVPGRFWADGDDDLIPLQLQFDETERLILRNINYNAVPIMLYDKQRIDDKNLTNDGGEMVPVKMSSGRPIKEAVAWFEGAALPQEVHLWRNYRLNDLQYHSGVFGSAIGEHQPGVNTFGGQEQFAQRAMQTLQPLQLLYKESNEQWAMQMLRIAAKNWIDDRVNATMGINGQWDFKKLKGEMLKLDKVRIFCRVIPLDYQQQQSFAQAVASGVLNPQDPRVQKKALELYQLPEELGTFSVDSKKQWKEIESMKQGQPVQPVAFRDNDQVHIEICRVWLNSDEADNMPQVAALVYQHLLAHLQNMQTVAMAQAAINPQAAQGQPQQKPNPNNNPQFRSARASKGAQAKPNRPQPPGGNQNRTGRPGMSRSSIRRRPQ